MIRAIFRWLGYYRIDYGFSCGRHWMSIDGKVIAQTPGDDYWLRDEDVQGLVFATVDHGKHWTEPEHVTEARVAHAKARREIEEYWCKQERLALGAEL